MKREIDFNWLHFTESTVEIINVLENKIELLVKNVSVVDTENHIQTGHHEKLSLIFLGVTKSLRRIVPYDSDSIDSSPLAPIDICDIEKSALTKNSFELEGVLTDPYSWIESWVIECDRVEVLDNDGSIFEVR